MYRAVMVDDEPFMLEGMRMMINWQRCGFTLCGEACTAQAALHLVDTLQPHLLITDVQLPGMLGTDLAAIVNHYHPHVIILFYSGHRDFSYAQSAIRSHAFGYLVKPIDTEEVESTLLRVKAELDARQAMVPNTDGQTFIVRDQVLRRIAYGDDSPENLLHTSVLMELQHNDPCYCAVLKHHRGAMPENAKLILASCSAVPFELSPTEYGLAFRQIERDIPLLERMMTLLADREIFTLSIGGVYRGAQGFSKSLQEGMDAQGLLFETHGSLRMFKSFDTQTAAWLNHACLSAIGASLTCENGDVLETCITALRQAVADTNPNLFALRYMAAMLDAMLPIAADSAYASFLRALWREETLGRDDWLNAFCDQLRTIRQTMNMETGENWPSPVQAAVAAIHTQYAQPLSLSRIAWDLRMNPAYLGQLVRKHTGATFHRHLLMTRMDHACLLLRQTAEPIGDIAKNVGFRDVDYFSQQFRSRMGMSPVAYRCAVAQEEDTNAPHQ